MKFQYQFSNLLGSVYKKGNLLFTPDGNSVISPVGNRITIYDLKNNKSFTLPVESRYNFVSVALSPNGATLIAVNEAGSASIVSMVSRRVIYKYEFKRPVNSLQFSPDGKHFAACKDNNVFVFNAPGHFGGKFNPFEMERVVHGSFDETTCIDWTCDSRIFAVGSKDTSVRVYSLEKFSNFRRHVLSLHSDVIVGVFFEKDSLDLTTISRNGHLSIWESNISLNELIPLESSSSFPAAPKKKRVKGEGLTDADADQEEDEIDLGKGELRNDALSQRKPDEVDRKDDGDEEESDDGVRKMEYKSLARHNLSKLVQGTHTLTSAAYHKDTHILVTGFSNGAFFLHELPDVNLIHSLSISEESISSLAINKTGDWIAIGCGRLGQLLVWEWQSETYVMKQQAHSSAMTSLTYSTDGLYIATGGDDGKVKLWNTQTGFCFVTFTEHQSSVTDVRFATNRKFLVSSSLDGTVRAFDMTRYRNFRTFTSPRPVQFSCISLDSTGEFVAAGGQDVFEVYLWSMKIGRLLEILTGHQGPVVSVAFSPVLSSTSLASVSWDKTLRIWNAVEHGSTFESIPLNFDGLCVAFRPDGKEVVVATLNGDLTMYDVETTSQTGSIEGRNDLGSGRSDTDLITAKKSLAGKAFTAVCYSADGNYILAGGDSKNVCIYHAKEAILVKKFEITQNRSFDAVDDFINRRKMTEFGNLALVEEREEREGGNVTVRLPGVKKGDMAARTFKPEVKVFSLEFSPTGLSWAAVTTEGLLVYSLDRGHVFDPFQLDIDITPDSMRENLRQEKYAQGVMMSLRLNEQNLIQEAVESVPPSHISLCVSSLPRVYVEKTLMFIASGMADSRHVEFNLLWVKYLLLASHSPPPSRHVLLALHKCLNEKFQQLGKICDFNKYTLKYLNILGNARGQLNITKEENDEEDLFPDEESDPEDFKMETN